jgi:hypothetical protein
MDIPAIRDDLALSTVQTPREDDFVFASATMSPR